MLGPPSDVPATWIGLAVVASVALAAVLAVPSSAPPDATRVAAAVDTVAATGLDARATVALDGSRVRISARAVALRTDAGTAHARFLHAVVPVRRGSPLWRVLRGRPIDAVFHGTAAVRRAIQRARSRPVRWRVDRETLYARHLVWEGIDVVIVGA